jgi:hypothetical protein
LEAAAADNPNRHPDFESDDSKSVNFRGLNRHNRLDLHPLISIYNILAERNRIEHRTLDEYKAKHNRLFDLD